MYLKKRAIEGIILAGSLAIMCSIAGTVQPVAKEAAPVAEEKKTEIATKYTGRTAGVIACLEQAEADAWIQSEMIAAEIEQTQNEKVASAEESLTEEELAWQNQLMADVDEFLYIRAAGDENAKIVGKLYKGDVAEVVETGDVWTHITSGNVDGYVKNEYCIFGLNAMEYANTNFETKAEIQTNGLRVRSEADTESAVLTAVSTGMTLTVDTSVTTDDEWVAVKYDGNTGYVSAEFVDTNLDLGEAVTIEEEQAALAKAQEEAKAQKETQTEAAAPVQNAAVTASVDDVTLLAALIQCEAGNEAYEGQVAVGAVVMNRVRSGGYPNSIYAVIYQPSQFPPAAKGNVASIAASGPKASCIQAAQEALNGMDNTGGATCFSRASSGRAGVVIGNHVFY